MQKVRIDIIGQKFGRLTVLKYAYTKKKVAYWECRCDCGNIKIVRGAQLKNGAVKSCGCLRKETTKKTKAIHNKHGSRLYKIWQGMKGRCFTPTNTKYKDYGARGITVCDEWLDFQNFYDWAVKNGYSDGLTIERIDVNGDYEPSNCRWATNKEQSLNKRNTVKIEIDGKVKTLTEWAEYTGIPRNTIYMRYRRGHRGKDLIKPIEHNKVAF